MRDINDSNIKPGLTAALVVKGFKDNPNRQHNGVLFNVNHKPYEFPKIEGGKRVCLISSGK